MNSFPKPVRERSRKVLDIVRDLDCCACGALGPSDPHHPEAGGMGTKCSDYLAIPLCHPCHVELHQVGKASFAASHPGYMANARRLILMELERVR